MAEVAQMPKPEAQEVVTKEVLRVVGLNAEAFSGAMNPSTIYGLMVNGSASIFPYYREVEAKDTAVNSALFARKMLVMAREMKVQSADEDNGQAKRYAEELASFLDSIPKFRHALWELLDAPGYGYAVVENLWEVNPPRIQKLIGRPQEVFRFGKTFEPQTGELLFTAHVGGDGAPVPFGQFIVNSYMPRHGDRRGIGLLRKLYWASWFKRQALRLHLKFLEKGPGTVVVKYGQGAGDTEKANALSAAQAIADEIAAAVPQGFEVMSDLLQTTRTRDANDFRALCDYFDAEMTRQILGQTLTTRGAEQGKGTMALGEVHQDLLFEIVKSDALDLEDAVNDQLCEPWLLWTFGPQALERAVRPWWTIDKEPEEDLPKNADLIQKAKNLGVDVPKTWAREQLQVPAAEEGEETLAVSTFPAGLFEPGG